MSADGAAAAGATGRARRWPAPPPACGGAPRRWGMGVSLRAGVRAARAAAEPVLTVEVVGELG